MTKLVPHVFRPWMLPLLVIALVAPSVAAFAVVGPQLGLAVGALTAGAVVVLAARARYDEPIEVAPRRDRRYRLLVVTAEPISEPREVEEIAAIAAEGQRVLGSDEAGEPEVLVVAPAVQTRLDRWASDVAEARGRARNVLAVSLATLTAAGLDVRGRVGDADAVQAVEDELRGFPAQEVALSGISSEDAEDVGRRLDRPVRRLGRLAGASVGEG
jgi:hypothetical protein